MTPETPQPTCPICLRAKCERLEWYDRKEDYYDERAARAEAICVALGYEREKSAREAAEAEMGRLRKEVALYDPAAIRAYVDHRCAEERRRALKEAIREAEEEEECGLAGSCLACRIAARIRALASATAPLPQDKRILTVESNSSAGPNLLREARDWIDKHKCCTAERTDLVARIDAVLAQEQQ